MIATVSDPTTVLSHAFGASGRFAEPRLLASGIPSDDFAAGPDGSIDETTHPFNTGVHVSASGFSDAARLSR